MRGERLRRWSVSWRTRRCACQPCSLKNYSMELAVSSHFVLCTHTVILFKNSITFPCALAHPLHLLYLLASREGILGSCWDHCVSWGKMDNVRGNIPNYLSHCKWLRRQGCAQIPAYKRNDSPELSQSPRRFCFFGARQQ